MAKRNKDKAKAKAKAKPIDWKALPNDVLQELHRQRRGYQTHILESLANRAQMWVDEQERDDNAHKGRLSQRQSALLEAARHALDAFKGQEYDELDIWFAKEGIERRKEREAAEREEAERMRQQFIDEGRLVNLADRRDEDAE